MPGVKLQKDYFASPFRDTLESLTCLQMKEGTPMALPPSLPFFYETATCNDVTGCTIAPCWAVQLELTGNKVVVI